MGWLSRIKHSRGFGVHSPFAFRFIMECLKESDAYYDYAQLPTPMQKQLYRIAVFFQPTEIVRIGDADIAPALLACPPGTDRHPGLAVIGTGVEHTSLAIANCKEPSTELLAAIGQALHKGQIVYAYNCTKPTRIAIMEMLQSLGYGLLFHNRRTIAIAIPFTTLPCSSIDF